MCLHSRPCVLLGRRKGAEQEKISGSYHQSLIATLLCQCCIPVILLQRVCVWIWLWVCEFACVCVHISVCVCVCVCVCVGVWRGVCE